MTPFTSHLLLWAVERAWRAELTLSASHCVCLRPPRRDRPPAQVIYHLNNKNEDHDFDLQEMAEQYESEIEQVPARRVEAAPLLSPEARARRPLSPLLRHVLTPDARGRLAVSGLTCDSIRVKILRDTAGKVNAFRQQIEEERRRKEETAAARTIREMKETYETQHARAMAEFQDFKQRSGSRP